MKEAIANDLQAITEAITASVNPVTIYLFGSYAYGTPNADSDIDIFAVVPDWVEDTHDINVKIRTAFLPYQRLPMDLLVEKESSFNKRSQSSTLERIVANQGIRIYG